MSEGGDNDFTAWLQSNKLAQYQAALEEQGYEDLYCLTLLSESELADLAETVDMKPGHKVCVNCRFVLVTLAVC